MNNTSKPSQHSELFHVWKTWWPLAGSWLLMGCELPLMSAVMARLIDPEISLAAYGGVVFPISLLIEAPIIMLLAASTALSKNWASYKQLRRFMLQLTIPLTALHILVAFTPLYDFIIIQILAVPEKIIEPARTGLMIMTPWTASIAIRRFQQGVLIRGGQSKSVATGTLFRLGINTFTLAVGLWVGMLSGIVVGSIAITLGVIAEAIFVNRRTQPLLHKMKHTASSTDTTITFAGLLHFYIPLAITPIMTLLALPIGTAAMSRMPNALSSMAVWPVVAGLSFAFRSVGLAYHEVVVALIEKPGTAPALRKFALLLGITTSSLLLLLTMTPLSHFWFHTVAGLSPDLVQLGTTSLWLAVLMPALTVLESWYQGILIQSHQTRAVTESVVIFLVGSVAVLVTGITLQIWPGIYVSLLATLVGFGCQTMWLGIRSKQIRQTLLRTTSSHEQLPSTHVGPSHKVS